MIVSALNDAESISELAGRLIQIFDRCSAYEWEAIVVDNGSQDETYMAIESILDRDSRFKSVQLTRHFDHDAGFSAGMALSDSDAVVLMHADLTDQPEMIPDFLDQWEAGFENVYAIDAPAHAGRSRTSQRSPARWIDRLSSRLTGGHVPSGSGDFRLLDRRVYEQVRDMGERNRFVQGLVAWVGFRSSGIELGDGHGLTEESKLRAAPRLRYKAKAVLAHSQIPLVFIPMFGIGLSVLAFFGLLGLTVNWLASGVPFPGFGTIVALMIMLFGVLFCMLGIMSIYIGLIYEEAKGRPNFVIRRKVGFEAAGARGIVQPAGSDPGVRSTVDLVHPVAGQAPTTEGAVESPDRSRTGSGRTDAFRNK